MRRELLVGDIYKIFPKDGAFGFSVGLCLGEYHSGSAQWLVEVLINGEIKIINRLDYQFEDINDYS